MALFKGNPLPYQTVKMGCVHVGKPELGNGVVPLLIRDDENDVGAIIIGDCLMDEHF